MWTIGQRDAAGIRSSLTTPIPSVRLTDEARRMLPASLPSEKLVDITAQSPQLDSTPRAAMVYSSTSLPHDAWIRVPHRLSASAGRGRLAWAASSRFSAMTNALPPLNLPRNGRITVRSIAISPQHSLQNTQPPSLLQVRKPHSDEPPFKKDVRWVAFKPLYQWP